MRLTTLFNGRPAPGGVFNFRTKVFTKRVRSTNGGRHPRLDAYGAIDGPVLDELKALGCEIIRLCLPGGEYFVRFGVFEARAFPVRWRGTLTEAREYRPLVIEAVKAAPRIQQLSLFAASPLELRQAHETGVAV